MARDGRREGGGGDGQRRIGLVSEDGSLDHCEAERWRVERERVLRKEMRVFGIFVKNSSLERLMILLKVDGVLLSIFWVH